MNSDKVFDSTCDLPGVFKSDWPQSVVKEEPMFFNADYEYGLSFGGPITRAFLKSVATYCPEFVKSGLVFDSRVHMLMPGWYPAIPGWHHDDVPRAVIPPGQHFLTAGQPDYDSPRYKAEHIMGLVNGSICPTQFIIGQCPMKRVAEGDLIYRQWHLEIESLIKDKKVSVWEATSGDLIRFNSFAFHTGVKARSNGWRWFGRVSRNTDRVGTTTNEIRTQVQVYLEFPMEGW